MSAFSLFIVYSARVLANTRNMRVDNIATADVLFLLRVKREITCLLLLVSCLFCCFVFHKAHHEAQTCCVVERERGGRRTEVLTVPKNGRRNIVQRAHEVCTSPLKRLAVVAAANPRHEAPGGGEGTEPTGELPVSQVTGALVFVKTTSIP